MTRAERIFVLGVAALSRAPPPSRTDASPAGCHRTPRPTRRRRHRRDIRNSSHDSTTKSQRVPPIPIGMKSGPSGARGQYVTVATVGSGSTPDGTGAQEPARDAVRDHPRCVLAPCPLCPAREGIATTDQPWPTDRRGGDSSPGSLRTATYLATLSRHCCGRDRRLRRPTRSREFLGVGARGPRAGGITASAAAA